MAPEYVVIVWYDGLGNGTGEVLNTYNDRDLAEGVARRVMACEPNCHAEVYRRGA